MYDYGRYNYKHYDDEKIPEIPVQNIQKVPIILYVGTADLLATLDDAKWINKNVKTVLRTVVVKDLDHTEMQHLEVDRADLPPGKKDEGAGDDSPEDKRVSPPQLIKMLAERDMYQSLEVLHASSKTVRECCD